MRHRAGTAAAASGGIPGSRLRRVVQTRSSILEKAAASDAKKASEAGMDKHALRSVADEDGAGAQSTAEERAQGTPPGAGAAPGTPSRGGSAAGRRGMEDTPRRRPSERAAARGPRRRRRSRPMLLVRSAHRAIQAAPAAAVERDGRPRAVGVRGLSRQAAGRPRLNSWGHQGKATGFTRGLSG